MLAFSFFRAWKWLDNELKIETFCAQLKLSSIEVNSNNQFHSLAFMRLLNCPIHNCNNRMCLFWCFMNRNHFVLNVEWIYCEILDLVQEKKKLSICVKIVCQKAWKFSPSFSICILPNGNIEAMNQRSHLWSIWSEVNECDLIWFNYLSTYLNL